MILPPGHHEAVTSRREFSKREKWIVGSVAATVAILAVAIVIALTGPKQTSAPGCVDVLITGVTGAASIHQCGANARALCRDAGRPLGYTGLTAQEIRATCRMDGLPVG
jgi:hypothetical protein